ncbi:MAG: ChbG/HpnK family deacetylase [Pseudomonadota bacterium]|nr:ChbG/HpnK family deacetylase [Pseudomonadota bacterium]
MEPLRVVVNADDLGMSPAVDRAIFAGVDAGYLTSTSVLANGPTVRDALRELATLGPGARVSVGVHLNLTEFAPLTRSVEHLLDPDGRFDPDSRLVRRTDADAVTAEWAAQIRRVLDAGVRVSHLDSHQHVHHHPLLSPVLTALRARFGIARVRGMGALRPKVGGSLGAQVHARLGALRQRARADRFIHALRRDGAVTTDGFASVSVFLAHAAALPREWRTVELMAHPGNPFSPAYPEEVERLAAGALAALPVRVEPVSWWEIAAR